MKKVITLIFALIIISSFGLVLADNDDDYMQRGSNLGNMTQAQEREHMEEYLETGERPDGVEPRMNQLREHIEERIYARTQGGISIRTRLNQSLGAMNASRIMLSNGRNAEIKIMPDVASEQALERLRLKNCNETRNCTIELKEVGEGNQTRLIYEARAEKTFRILGFIKNKEQIKAQIDAETGEEVEVRRPWWAFLASESSD